MHAGDTKKNSDKMRMWTQFGKEMTDYPSLSNLVNFSSLG